MRESRALSHGTRAADTMLSRLNTHRQRLIVNRDATRRDVKYQEILKECKGVSLSFNYCIPLQPSNSTSEELSQCMNATVVQISPCTVTLVNSLYGLIRAKEFNFKATTQNTQMLVIPIKTLLYVVNYPR